MNKFLFLSREFQIIFAKTQCHQYVKYDSRTFMISILENTHGHKKRNYLLFYFNCSSEFLSVDIFFFFNLIENTHPINAVMRNYDRQARDPVYRPCC